MAKAKSSTKKVNIEKLLHWIENGSKANWYPSRGDVAYTDYYKRGYYAALSDLKVYLLDAVNHLAEKKDVR